MKKVLLVLIAMMIFVGGFVNIGQAAFAAEVDKDYNFGKVQDINKEVYASSVKYFNAPTTMYFAGDLSTDDKRKVYTDAIDEMFDKIEEIELSLSSSIEGADIYKFNHLSAGGKLQVSRTTYEVIKKAKDIYTLTKGAYDPTVYYIVDMWGFSPAVVENAPYAKVEFLSDDFWGWVNELKGKFSFDMVTVYAEGTNYYLSKSLDSTISGAVNGVAYNLNLRLDFGGIGKGYAADECSKIAAKYGITQGWINVGGSSQSVLSCPADRSQSGNWDLQITNPRGKYFDDKDDVFANVRIKDTGISTSGDYEKYHISVLQEKGIRYCHIMDKATGAPVQTGISSVTISGVDAGSADALTTSIMVMGLDKAVEFINSPAFKATGIEVMFVYEDQAKMFNRVITNAPNKVSIKLDGFVLANKLDSNGNIVLQMNKLPQSFYIYIVLGVVIVLALIVLIIVRGGKHKIIKTTEQQNREKIMAAKNGKFFRKGDAVVYVVTAVVILALFVAFVFAPVDKGLDYITIYSHGETVYTFDCANGKGDIASESLKDRVQISSDGGNTQIKVIDTDGGFNTVLIGKKDGKYFARVIEADCSATKECVNSFTPIFKGNSVIVCTVHSLIVKGSSVDDYVGAPTMSRLKLGVAL